MIKNPKTEKNEAVLQALPDESESMAVRTDASKDGTRGTMTLEMAIVLPIFIFIFLFIFSLFWTVSAQNQITHALVQSSKSMSLDSYLTESYTSAYKSDTSFWSGVGDMLTDLMRLTTDDSFTSYTDWYESSTGSSSVAKDRFVGYLTGGDEDAADDKLRHLGVVGGLDGITFTMEIDDELMTVTISYELEYVFDFFGIGKIPMEQSITTRLWM